MADDVIIVDSSGNAYAGKGNLNTANPPKVIELPDGHKVNLANADELVRTHTISGGSSTKTVKRYLKQIREHGIESIDPISVVQINGKSYIVDGHHRYLAAKRLGVDEIPIKVVKPSDVPNYNGIQGILDSAESTAGLPDRIKVRN